MSEFTPAFSRPVKVKAVCIGGPLRGKDVVLQGTHVKVLGSSGSYQWVHSLPLPGHNWIGAKWFAVWFPNG